MTEQAVRINKMSEGKIIEANFSRHQIEFEGFTPTEQKWVSQVIQLDGLPLTNINKVEFRENQRGEEDVLGQYHYPDSTLTLYKSLTREYLDAKSREQVQAGTIVHEKAHSFDPYTEGKAGERILEIYGSEEERTAAAERVSQIADQTDKTHVFLNGYHRYNYQVLVDARMNFKLNPTEKNKRNLEVAGLIFKMETHAIMTELRFINPRHLEEVSEAQNAKLAKRGEKGIDITEATDKTLMNIMKMDQNQLNSHIGKYRIAIAGSVSPLQGQLAA
jgi:hypothetical protein